MRDATLLPASPRAWSSGECCRQRLRSRSPAAILFREDFEHRLGDRGSSVNFRASAAKNTLSLAVEPDGNNGVVLDRAAERPLGLLGSGAVTLLESGFHIDGHPRISLSGVQGRPTTTGWNVNAQPALRPQPAGGVPSGARRP